jgi:hypothetical protein
MTLGEKLGLSSSQERALTRLLQVVLVGITIYGLVTVRLGVALQGGFTFAITLLPALIRREYDYSMDPGLVLWITIAVFLNILGMLGLYAQYQWYDEITHTISATVMAGLGYASFRAFELHSEEIDVPPTFRAVFIVVFVLAAAVAWEIMEFGSELLADLLGTPAPIVIYGIDDIVTDMIFNTVGALIVAIWGIGYVSGLVGFFRNRFRSGADR